MAEQSNFSYVIPEKVFSRLQDAEIINKHVYICARFGVGKTMSVLEYYKNRDIKYIICSKNKMDISEPSSSMKKHEAVIIDNLPVHLSEECRQYIHTLIGEGVRIVAISRTRIPYWLIGDFENAVFIHNDDYHFTEVMFEEMIKNTNITLSKEEITDICEYYCFNALGLKVAARFLEQYKESISLSTERASIIVNGLLETNIYERWSIELRELMLQMSMFETFTEEMARMITGYNDASIIIDNAVSEDEYMVEIDTNTYTINNTIRRFLDWKRKSVFSVVKLHEIYYIAGVYYELKDDIHDAIENFWKAESEEKVASMLTGLARKNIGLGMYHELRDYYHWLNKDIIVKSPELMTGMSIIYSEELSTDKSEYWYTELEKFFIQAAPDSIDKKNALTALSFLNVTLPHRKKSDIVLMLNDIAEKSKSREINEISLSATMSFPSIINGTFELIDKVNGDYEMTEAEKENLRTIFGKKFEAIIELAKGENAFEQDKVDIYETISLINNGYALAETTNSYDLCFVASSILSKIHLSKGTIESAYVPLNGIAERVKRTKLQQLYKNIRAHEAMVHMYAGDYDEVNKWLEEDAPNEYEDANILFMFQYAIKIGAYLINEKYDMALVLIEKYSKMSELYNRRYSIIESYAFRSICLYNMHIDKWKENLITALKLASEIEYVDIIAKYGSFMNELLKEIDISFLSEKYRERLLQACNRYAIFYPVKHKNEEEKKLTDMEKKVLRMLCDAKTNEEISEALCITISTVKYHCRNIYRKLGAASRTEAVVIANKCGIS